MLEIYIDNFSLDNFKIIQRTGITFCFYILFKQKHTVPTFSLLIFLFPSAFKRFQKSIYVGPYIFPTPSL